MSFKILCSDGLVHEESNDIWRSYFERWVQRRMLINLSCGNSSRRGVTVLEVGVYAHVTCLACIGSRSDDGVLTVLGEP